MQAAMIRSIIAADGGPMGGAPVSPTSEKKSTICRSRTTVMAAGVLPQKLDHEEVLAVGLQVRDTFVRPLKSTLPRL